MRTGALCEGLLNLAGLWTTPKMTSSEFNTILPLGISSDVRGNMDKGNKCGKSTKNAVSHGEIMICEDLS